MNTQPALVQNKKLVIGFIAALLLSGCGGGGGSTTKPPTQTPNPTPTPTPPPATSTPDYHLGTARFTTHQPRILEQIGAHHAYARGLTGKGVRIGIDDSIVDYTQTAEFGNRVKLRNADGASLLYSRPLGDQPLSDVSICRSNPSCSIWEGNSGGDLESHNSWAQQIVRENGWPTRDDSVFVLDKHHPYDGSIGQFFRWWEVPTPYGRVGSHGTTVASIAAGTNLGVAPEATIIPVANNLSDDQIAAASADRALRLVIATLPSAVRRELDDLMARDVRENLANFDVINRSYGTRASTLSIIANVDSAQWYRTYLPKTLNAIWQSDRPDAEKTIIVYAAGNDGDPVPGLGALLPYVFPELRGHSLAVAATDPRTGVIAGYSNRCGQLPSNWNSARHGPHYCLAAPGTVRGLVPNSNRPGRGDARSGLPGTSYAAPVVSGALALLKEHFRGTRGNTAIVKRMLDTADRTGIYADHRTYGAGHLDLEAALSPVGTLSAGQTAQALSGTTLQLPAAFGSFADRLGNIELATFDEQDFPFWVSVTTLVSTRESARSPIPVLKGTAGGAPVTDPDVFGLSWMPVGKVESLWLADGNGWITGLGPASASLARSSHEGGWGYGFSFENSGYMGAEASGAFGSSLHSGMVWSSRTFRHRLDDGWTLDAVGTLALSMPQYDRDAIFRASPSILSAVSMRLGTESTGLVIEQPLRAESGTGTFRIENGRIENGRRLYDEHRVPLRPGKRETRMTLRHDREVLGGEMAFQVSSAVNAGHVSGKRDSSLGMAYRINW